MSTGTISSKIPELRQAVRDADEAAYLVEPRVVRRIIRELHGFARLSSRIPHVEVLVAKANDIRALAHPDELGLEDFQQLSPLSILVAQPEEHELDGHSLQDLLLMTWARLFHGRVDMRLRNAVNDGSLTRTRAEDLIDQIGQAEFDEALSVLASELRLFDPESRQEAWCELTTQYMQLARFSPDLLPIWFPSLAYKPDSRDIIEQQLDADAIFEKTRLVGAVEPDGIPGVQKDEDSVSNERQTWGEGISLKPSVRRYGRLMKSRDRSNERGNTVAAGVSAMRAVEVATTEGGKEEALVAARSDIATMANRLRDALKFPEADVDDWQQSLWELLKNSTHGFWNADKKLLYDLQKVCLDHERTIYRVDLIKWIASRGKRALRRPLTNVREVMMAKHLASCASRLVYVRLSGIERQRLTQLLHDAAHLAEMQMRERMRPTVHDTLNRVGLTPNSIPEQVALDKMVEESLDVITERGYLTMGYLRDAISRNDLKLPDLTDPKDLIRGDHLLRIDDQLDVSLDGVYRRGEFYLRWLQVISSLAFGTKAGRFVTQFIAIPFGGAVIIVEGVQHTIKVLTGQGKEDDTAASDESGDTAVDGDSESLAADPLEESGLLASNESATPDTEVAVADANPTVAAANDVSSTESPDNSGDSGAPSINLPSLNEDGQPVDNSADVLTAANYEIPVNEVMSNLEVPLIAIVGFLLMAVIHVMSIRNAFFAMLRYLWKGVKAVTYDLPIAIVKLPAIHKIWRARWFVKLRRHVLTPVLVSWVVFRVIPDVVSDRPQQWWLVGTIAFLLSLALNSRLGRDTEELTAEWLGNVWYDLRSRFLMALFEWVMDFFKWMLNLLERFIYAVDEWLRFHSGETWVTLVAKAILGVGWSFVAFLIRIYVNLLIEPTLHPVKHFPVVTVAHKIFLPVILIIESYMRETLTPYLGPIAGPFTWFNIAFLPGIFGFLVWELKENWRLYSSNREPTLHPVVVGSHGETGGRLLRPGFHSGTLPKLYTRLRRLERKEASFHRFSQRRALRERLEHTEEEIRRFVERDLVRLLHYCPVWQDAQLKCVSVRAASNSFEIELAEQSLGDESVCLLFQDQDGWLVASISRQGWLRTISPEQQHSFETAMRGFYKKAGVELVREQIERNVTGRHPYDVCRFGLLIWPDRQFGREISIDLHRRHQLRPVPASMAASYGIQPLSREGGVFAETDVRWTDWQQVWVTPEGSESSRPLPMACMQTAQASLLASGKSS